MMKKFMIPCDFGDQESLFEISVGEPCAKRHPLHYQAQWLRSERKGTIPPDVMDSFQKLYDIAKRDGTSFEELCVEAMKAPEI